MGARFTVHEVDLSGDTATGESMFTVKLPDGRKIGMFSSGSDITVYIPYGDPADGWTPGAGYASIDIELPKTMDDVAEGCSKDDFDANGNFTVIAHHRH